MNRAARRKQIKGGVELQQLLQQGMMLHQQGRLDEAEQCYLAILKADSKQPDALQLQGLIDQQLGRPELAQKRMRQSLSRKPEQPHVWYNLAKLLQETDDIAAAIEANGKAIALEKSHVDAYLNRANLYTQLRDYGKAIEDFERVLVLQPDHPHVIEPLVLSMKEVGLYEEAIALLYERLAQDPEKPPLWLMLGKALREHGDKSGAVESLEKAITLEPKNADAHYNLSLMVKYKPDAQYNKDQLESLIGQEMSLDDQIYLRFALAKAYDDLGELEKAFIHYDKANALKRGTVDYDSRANADKMNAIISTFTEEVMNHQVETASDVMPIFILGMPRSGTSLIEQILASHSKVTGAGELNDFRDTVGDVTLEKVTKLSDNQLKKTGKQYLKALTAHGDTPYVCDKMPANFWNIGMIRKCLPKAKIIHVQRDSVNTSLSIYTRLFFGNQPFAYDQAELGEYYKQYEKLMGHWREVCGDAMLEVNYEDVVGDTEAEVRRMLDYCGLEWQEACLNFHQTKRAVDTASAMQVRQPIYKDSLDRAQSYTPYIQPLIKSLQQ